MKIDDPEVASVIWMLVALSVFILLNIFGVPRITLYFTSLAFLISYLFLSIRYLFLGLRVEKLRLKVYYIVHFVLGVLIASYSIFLFARFLGWL